MSKKASANMWWIIIGAVIALVVMIILMVMFTSKTQPLEAGLSSCESKGGVCAPQNIPCPTNTFSSSAFDCDGVGTTCCIGSPKGCSIANPCPTGQECNQPFSGKNYCYTPK